MGKSKYQFKPKATPAEMVIVAVMIIIMIAMSTQVHLKHPLKVADPMDAAPMDARTRKLVAATGAQVVPGKSVGKIKLGEEGEKLASILGKPAMGDAAMCKSWSRWKWGKPANVVEVFESCDPQKDMRKTVQQIRFSGIPLGTRDDISTKSTFAQIKGRFPGLVAEATFTSKETGKNLMVLDQVQEGIAFVVDAAGDQPDPEGKCHMIIIHLPGKKAIDTYLQPEWTLHPL